MGGGGERQGWISQEPWHCVIRHKRREEEEVREEERRSLATDRRRQAMTAMWRRGEGEGRRAASRKNARLVARRGRWRGRGREE